MANSKLNLISKIISFLIVVERENCFYLIAILKNHPKRQRDLSTGNENIEFESNIQKVAQVTLILSKDTQSQTNEFIIESIGFFESQTNDKKRWKKFKRKITAYLEELGFNEWELKERPDSKPGSLLYDQFKCKLGRDLDGDEVKCFRLVLKF